MIFVCIWITFIEKLMARKLRFSILILTAEKLKHVNFSSNCFCFIYLVVGTIFVYKNSNAFYFVHSYQIFVRILFINYHTTTT